MIHDRIILAFNNEAKDAMSKIVTALLTKRFEDLAEVARLQGEYQGIKTTIELLAQINEENDL